ncbi:DNA polymerase delta subunit 1 [Vigna unguiculata]|uniref:DNA polymerase delta subunit 1 n=1 Tax=Vigna unguiculata TaxID=3917 RepID=A0A4D6NP34_VIGUN|nr:DNA polymerase delta subunit 1 [Vigna unguiculata]
MAPQPLPPKQALMTQEEDFVDEDVFIDQTLVSKDEEFIILRDIEQRQALGGSLV